MFFLGKMSKTHIVINHSKRSYALLIPMNVDLYLRNREENVTAVLILAVLCIHEQTAKVLSKSTRVSKKWQFCDPFGMERPTIQLHGHETNNNYYHIVSSSEFVYATIRH